MLQRLQISAAATACGPLEWAIAPPPAAAAAGDASSWSGREHRYQQLLQLGM